MDIYSKPNVKFSTAAGEDGWLYVWNMDGIEVKATGELLYNEVELEAVGRAVELRAAWCRDRGISYIHMIAPDKTSVYPQHFPDKRVQSKERMIHQCRAEWNRKSRRINFVDTLPMLEEWSKSYDTYFKTDSHWNYKAALAIFNEVANRLIGRFPDFRPFKPEDVATRSVTRVFELGALLDPPVKETAEIMTPKTVSSKVVFDSPSARGKIQVFETGNAELPRCIVFRDSFTSFFLPFLCERCSRIVVINSKNFWYQLVESEKPDIVIMEMAERYLHPNAFDVYGRNFDDTFGVTIKSISESSLTNPMILTAAAAPATPTA